MKGEGLAASGGRRFEALPRPGDGEVVEAVAEVIEPASRSEGGRYVVLVSTNGVDLEVVGEFTHEEAQAWRDGEGVGVVRPLTMRPHRGA